MYHPSTNHITLLALVVFSLFNIFYLLQPTLGRYIIYYDAQVQEATKRKRVDRFSNDMQLNVDRGLNILNGFSGPRISTWVYEGVHSSVPKHLRTWFDEPEEKILRNITDATKLSFGDTLFVSFPTLKEFITDFLPHLNTRIVLISMRWVTASKDVEWLSNFSNFTDSPYILHWFVTDMMEFNGGNEKNHSKISPFPLGLKPNMRKVGMGAGKDFQNPVPIYQKQFLKSMHDTEFNKTNPFFVGLISKTSDKRKNVPSGKKLKYDKYLEEIARSSYVISPDGLFPECHRHYEALGLGAVPITQLNENSYSHLKEGNHVIFNQTNYSLDYMKSTLPFPPAKVNRNMVFEEYWLEYVERVVGQELWWWDVVGGKRSKLATFANHSNYSSS